ncbi:BgTH12-04957 [Blumeria graminis f. sp. triticale]|uniref:BgTH12-04957 n=1 Tax=Blumeria graminis f. sp. triticale TaxID=1689686 RepID=A0A9W4DIG4_BLUGR|nr:BgTH12-04957 [Blumeria graminis f. sp. triticale]
MSNKGYASDAESSTLVPSSLSGDIRRGHSLDTSLKQMHEESPLLSPQTEITEVGRLISSRDFDQEYIIPEDGEKKSILYMILLTISLGGLQLAWSVEISNGTPYLLSLGMSKSLMALVWIAGPLSGTLVQPYVGMLSDKCRSPWGKRTPFIIIGSAATIVSLLALGWVREIVVSFFGIFGSNPESQLVRSSVLILAVIFVYILDFSINTVQAGIRAFILDCSPSNQQETANSMASRAVGIGNIVGYVAGFVDMKPYLWFLGNSQFKILCAIACIALALTVLLSVSTIKERDPRLETQSNPGRTDFLTFFKTFYASIRRLPPLTRKVCEIQFFAWIGYFPQLFYSSSYIGDIYVQPYLKENPHMSLAELDSLYEKATRVGTLALLFYAITSLITNLLLPSFIAPSYDKSSATAITSRSSTQILVIRGFTLRRAWLYSHIIFSTCMFSTLIVRSVSAATALISIVGICWALTLWAPFAIISAEVSKRDALRRSRIAAARSSSQFDLAADANEDQAGVILGIHNMSIAAPQIFATVGSSIVFRFLQKPRGTPGDQSMSFVLAAGGIFTVVAAWLTSRMENERIEGEIIAETWSL